MNICSSRSMKLHTRTEESKTGKDTQENIFMKKSCLFRHYPFFKRAQMERPIKMMELKLFMKLSKRITKNTD